jgi:hypothetical protein
VIDVGTGEVLSALDRGGSWPPDLAVSPGGQQAALLEVGHANVWELPGLTPVASVPLPRGARSLAVADQDRAWVCFYGSDDHLLGQIDVASETYELVDVLDESFALRSVVLAPDGQTLALLVSTESPPRNTLVILDAATLEFEVSVPWSSVADAPRVWFSTQGTLVCGDDGKVLDVAAHQMLAQLPVTGWTVRWVDANETAGHIRLACDGGVVLTWSWPDLQSLGALELPAEAMAFSDNELSVATHEPRWLWEDDAGALRILAVADHGLFYGGADRLLRLP